MKFITTRQTKHSLSNSLNFIIPNTTIADISGWTFTDGIAYTFPPGTLLAPDDYVVVGQDVTAISNRFGVNALGPFTGKLTNLGEKIELRNASNVIVDKVDYGVGFPWPSSSHGEGSSMELIHYALDNDLAGSWRSSGFPVPSAPTPGAVNTVFSVTAAPQIRQVDHLPMQPVAGEAVTISCKVTDPDGVQSVNLEYQLVNPGSYIRQSDAAYAANWTSLPMFDNGTNGDAVAGDDTYTMTMAGTFQTHRRLVRYRIRTTDNSSNEILVPYQGDDPQPNFAYFCYNGVPDWNGGIAPGHNAGPEFSLIHADFNSGLSHHHTASGFS